MLMHATANGDVVRESALKIDSGRKKLAAPGLEPISELLFGFSVGRFTD